MLNLIHSNALTNFLSKNLNTDEWSVYNANPDSKIKNRFVITLKAKKTNILFDENTKQKLTVKKNGYIRGLIEPVTCCLRIVLYIEPNLDNDDNIYKILNTTTLQDVKIANNTIHIIHSYIPEKQKCIKLQQIENKTKSQKKLLNDLLPYDPDYGEKYLEHISKSEFKKRWNIN